MVCLVFFFKQKTAYEMRISDWSSDVCSSDLNRLLGMTETAIRDVAAILARLADGDVSGRIEAAYEGLFGSLRDDTNALSEQLARKSVVWGKSESVRVDPGGRRIIKTKNLITNKARIDKSDEAHHHLVT